jgi:hypothetical protein
VKPIPIVAVLVLLLMPARLATAQVDLAGDWRAVQHEDTFRRGGVLIGEYVGLPLTAGARLRAESWTGSLLTVPEHQCIPHPVTYAEHSYAMNQMRIWNVVDPETARIVAIRKRGTWMEPERTIWLDGRPHPPDTAPHTWQGFSTGRWAGHVLDVTTTHIKAGHIQMNGVSLSDEVTMTEHFIRRGNYLTNITIIDDPVYLTDSFIRSSTWTLDPSLEFVRYPCGPNEVVVEIPRAPDAVPHILPGANDQLADFARRYGLPLEAALGGAETMYPEYMEKLKTMKPAAPAKAAAGSR